MSLAGYEKVFDEKKISEVVEMMQQMVCRYLNLNIPCRSLRFYAPAYFMDELIHTAQHHPVHGVAFADDQLTVWGAEVHIGYENTIILFCPEKMPASHSPVIAINRFGLSNMEVVNRH